MQKPIVAVCSILIALLFLGGFAIAESGIQVSVEGGSYRSISTTDLYEMLKSKDFFLVNVHVPYAGEIEGTDAFISYMDTQNLIGDYPKSKNAKIVVYCLTNHMSAMAARDLVSMGYTNIYLLDGGMTAWQEAGFPLKHVEGRK